MLSEACREFVLVALFAGSDVGIAIDQAREPECSAFVARRNELLAQYKKEKSENTPEALRRKGYVVCEKKGELTACK